MELNVFLAQATMIILHMSITIINGLLVKYKDVRVNYTRKINHFCLFFLPVFINSIFPHNRSLISGLIGMGLMIAILGLYIEPIRKRVGILNLSFMSFDRPEDRPYTLLWLFTQVIAGFLVVIPLYIYFYSIDMMPLIYIPLLINGIGDGLAEPVGIRFGKHFYESRALFTSRRYVRTIEGSACVFFTSVVTLFIFKNYFSMPQLIVAFALIPVIMTVVEAVSPHTWDTPFIYGAAGLSVYGVFLI